MYIIGTEIELWQLWSQDLHPPSAKQAQRLCNWNSGPQKRGQLRFLLTAVGVGGGTKDLPCPLPLIPEVWHSLAFRSNDHIFRSHEP